MSKTPASKKEVQVNKSIDEQTADQLLVLHGHILYKLMEFPRFRIFLQSSYEINIEQGTVKINEVPFDRLVTSVAESATREKITAERIMSPRKIKRKK